MDAADQAEPLERLPEFRPLRLYLPGRKGAISVGTDGEEGGVSQIQQAGIADDDVETERQRREGAGIGRSIDVAAVAVDQREGEEEDTDGGQDSHTPLRRRNPAQLCSDGAADLRFRARGFRHRPSTTCG